MKLFTVLVLIIGVIMFVMGILFMVQLQECMLGALYIFAGAVIIVGSVMLLRIEDEE